MLQNNFHSVIKNIAVFGEKLSLPTYIISAVLIITSFGIVVYFQIELYFLLGIVGIAMLWLMLHYPKVWIYCIVIGCSLFLQKEDENISESDIFAAAFFNVFLIIWFVTKLLVKSEKQFKLTKNNSTLKITILSEKLFILFYFLLLFNSIIAVANGVNIIDWTRDYMLFTLMLYYFPIRDYFNDKQSIITLLIVFAGVILFLDIQQFYIVFKAMKNIQLAYEIGHTGLKLNQELFSAAILSGITIFLYTKNKLGKIFTYFVVVLTIFALIATFSRAFWISVMFLIILLSIIYLKPKQFFQLFIVVIVTVGVLFVSLDTFFPKQSNMVQKFIVKRFESSAEGTKDASIEARLREYKVVIQEIYEAPIFGQGLRKEFSFYNIVHNSNLIVSFVHNGYLNLTHKTGIPMTALFYFVIVLFNLRGYIIAWKIRNFCIKNNLNKKNQYYFFVAIAISASLVISMLLITNMVTSSFFMRAGFIVTAFSLAFISIAERKYNEINTNQTENIYETSIK